MKELLKKKSVKISLLFIILLVIMGIVGINVRSAQRQREYDAHIAEAEKYLTELDYEQAIAEYTMAFEIEPKEEVVDALEQAYLAYAQSLTDAGDYDKTVSILEEGYEKTGRESLQDMIEELQVVQEEIRVQEAELQAQKQMEEEQRASGMIEFPFQMTDITFMGYDLFGDYFEQLEELFLAHAEGDVTWLERDEAYPIVIGHTSDGWRFETHNSISEYDDTMSRIIWLRQEERGRKNAWHYSVTYRSNGSVPRLDLTADASRVFDYGEINVPVKTGETYEDWCRVMQINRIKENNLRPEERDGMVGIWDEEGHLLASGYSAEGNENWLFSTEWYQGTYTEYDSGDGYRYSIFHFTKPGADVAREKWSIHAIRATINADGVIEEIYYTGWPIAE